MKTTFVEQKRGAFANAVSAAEPGEQLVYHVGNICEGPHKHEARAAYDAGLVLLTSRRTIDGMFEFIAVRRRPKKGRARDE